MTQPQTAQPKYICGFFAVNKKHLPSRDGAYCIVCKISLVQTHTDG
jgi:hypothetical protein